MGSWSSRRALIGSHHDGTFDAVRAPLHGRGVEAVRATNGNEVISMGAEGGFDLVVLLDSLPGHSGLSMAHRLSEISDVGIVMVSHHADPIERARALEVCVDDYWVLPMSDAEMYARAAAVMRRCGRLVAPSTVRVGELTIDLGNERCTNGDSLISLTPTEWRVLKLLATYHGNHVPTDIVVAYVWGADANPDPGSLRVHLSNLRRKLEPDRSKPRYLITKPGFGLALAAE